MKRVADEGEPAVVAPLVVEQVEVGLALHAIPPDVAGVLVALEGNMRNTICATVR